MVSADEPDSVAAAVPVGNEVPDKEAPADLLDMGERVPVDAREPVEVREPVHERVPVEVRDTTEERDAVKDGATGASHQKESTRMRDRALGPVDPVKPTFTWQGHAAQPSTSPRLTLSVKFAEFFEASLTVTRTKEGEMVTVSCTTPVV